MPASSNPIADLNDSLLGWATQTELTVAQRLSDVEYFADAGIASDELERIERFYGTFLSRQLAAGSTFADLMEITPALASATLVARASRVVDPESFVAEYLGGLELAADPEWSAAIAERGVDTLRAAGLAVPGDARSSSLFDLAATHAGVTAAAVPGVIEALDAGETPEVQSLAPEYTERLLTEIEKFRAYTAEHLATWRNDAEFADLPAMVAELVAAELRERPAGTVGRETAVGEATREQTPRIILDATRGKVCLRLPEQILGEDDPDGEIQWRVSLDGTTKVYRTARPWGSEAPFTEALDITIARQVREVTVADVTTESMWVVPVVDSLDPVLVFTPKGQNITDKASLHYSELFVVCPTDATLVDVVTGDPIPVTDTFDIEGWSAWHCRRLDTRSVASLQVVREGESPSLAQKARCIDPRQRVLFRDPGLPIPYVRSLGGLPVHAESLVAEFPPTLSGQAETWYLSISAYAGTGYTGEEVAPAEALEVPAEGGVFDIFDPELYDAPWVGEYLIRLRGPRNESFRHEYAIVEGMEADTEITGLCRSFRIPAQGGLSTAELVVTAGEKPFAVDGDVVVRPEEAGANFTISTDEGDQMPLRFTPPRLRFEVPTTTEPPMWRTTRLVCQPRHFDAQGTLRIRATGELGTPKITVRNHHGAPLRTLALESEDLFTYTAPMAQLAASAAVVPAGSLMFEWTDRRNDKRVSVNLAHIDSTPHATGCTVEDGALHFANLATGRELSAWVWPATAPWAPARTIPKVSPKVALPESLIDAGDLVVQLFSADPFSALRAPLAPGKEALRVAQDGYFAAQDEAFAELSAFLAGQRDEAPNSPQVWPAVWDYLAGWDSTAIQSAVLGVMQDNPNAALKGLSASLVPAGAQPGRVITSGLVHGKFVTDEATEVHRTAWIGTLELLGQLPERYAKVEEGAPRAELREIHRQLEAVAGKRLLETLATGRDATLDTACVDKSTVQIAQMDAAQQQTLLDMFFSQAEIVPGPIMDDSARLMAVFDTFKQREQLGHLLRDQQMVKAAAKLLKAIRGANRQLYASARIRFDKLDGVDTKVHAWALAPVISMVFALAARMHAHGMMSKSKPLTSGAQGWSHVADLVPDLVTGDLIAAEAMVLAVEHPGIAG